MTSTQPPPAPEPLTAAAPITLDRNSEARRAYRESRTAITLLQQRWPAAFPQTPQQVRPLITGIAPLIAAALDWSHPYTRAVLRTWKLRPAYCRAVLEYPVRFDWMATQPSNRSARTLVPWQEPPGDLGEQTQPASAAQPARRSGTTASRSTQVLNRRKPAHTVIAPAPSQRRSKSPN